MLNAPLINKGFVVGDSSCNYEIYLLELINASSWFKNHYPGLFVKPSVESHGENDAINECYQLDFKLFAASTALRAKNLLSPQVVKVSEGVVFNCESKAKNTTLRATRIFAAFRDKSLDELRRLRSTNIKNHSIENDIVSVLKVLETKKNILLFFPYTFTFDSPIDNEKAINDITDGLNSDFKNAFFYRNKVAEGFDTYLTCIFNNQFLLFRMIDNQLLLCDQVRTEQVPTYCKLLDYCNRF